MTRNRVSLARPTILHTRACGHATTIRLRSYSGSSTRCIPRVALSRMQRVPHSRNGSRSCSSFELRLLSFVCRD